MKLALAHQRVAGWARLGVAFDEHVALAASDLDGSHFWPQRPARTSPTVNVIVLPNVPSSGSIRIVRALTATPRNVTVDPSRLTISGDNTFSASVASGVRAWPSTMSPSPAMTANATYSRNVRMFARGEGSCYGKVPPRLARHDLTDRVTRNAERARDVLVKNAARGLLTNHAHVVGVELLNPVRIPPPLVNGVVDVALLRREEEMPRIDAGRHVAAMADNQPVWDWDRCAAPTRSDARAIVSIRASRDGRARSDRSRARGWSRSTTSTLLSC
jgi:hypothetical protein